jgi:hypothetical protein
MTAQTATTARETAKATYLVAAELHSLAFSANGISDQARMMARDNARAAREAFEALSKVTPSETTYVGVTASGKSGITKYHVVREIETLLNDEDWSRTQCGQSLMPYDVKVQTTATPTNAPVCKTCARKVGR